MVCVKHLEQVPEIDPDAEVKLKQCGHVLEVCQGAHANKNVNMLKLSADEYLVTRTGQVKEFRHQTSRADNLGTVSRSLARGRDLLNANIDDVKKCRWLTLTYAENMTDPHRLYLDFQHFNVRCRKIYGHYEYITAAEPQGRGAWHLHVVLLFDHTAPFMNPQTVSECWRQGFVKVKRLDDVDNVGAYLTAYLGDMDLSEAHSQGIKGTIKTVEYTEDGEQKSKKYVKGARMSMYPPKFNIFRYSRGIKQPEVSYIPYREVKEKAGVASPTFCKCIVLEDPEKGFQNRLVYEYYNTMRK